MKLRIESMQKCTSVKSPDIKARCNLIINETVKVCGVLLKQSSDGKYSVNMPRNPYSRDEYDKEVAHPVTKDLRLKITSEVARAYELGDGYVASSEAFSDSDKKAINFNFEMGKDGVKTIKSGELWIGKEFVIHNVTVREAVNKEDGTKYLFVALPSKQADNGKYYTLVNSVKGNDSANVINERGLSAYKQATTQVNTQSQKQSVGNIPYRELKENSTGITVYRHQDVKHGEKIGEILTACGVKWAGFIDKKGMSVVVSSDDADKYVTVEKSVIESETAKNTENVVSEPTVVEEITEISELEYNYPF